MLSGRVTMIRFPSKRPLIQTRNRNATGRARQVTLKAHGALRFLELDVLAGFIYFKNA